MADVSGEDMFVNMWIAHDVETIKLVPLEALREAQANQRVLRAAKNDREHVIADVLWKIISPALRKTYEDKAAAIFGVPVLVPAPMPMAAPRAVLPYVAAPIARPNTPPLFDPDPDSEPELDNNERKVARPPRRRRPPPPDAAAYNAAAMSPRAAHTQARGRTLVPSISFMNSIVDQQKTSLLALVEQRLNERSIMTAHARVCKRYTNNLVIDSSLHEPPLVDLYNAVGQWLICSGVFEAYDTFRDYAEFTAFVIANQEALNLLRRDTNNAARYLPGRFRV